MVASRVYCAREGGSGVGVAGSADSVGELVAVGVKVPGVALGRGSGVEDAGRGPHDTSRVARLAESRKRRQ
jgi:hypothetical protein